MKATYDLSISSAPAIESFYVPAGFICYILACLRCLWATVELQDSWLRGLSFQMGNFCFLPGTHGGIMPVYIFIWRYIEYTILILNLIKSKRPFGTLDL